MNFSLNTLYQSIGISKQAFHQRMERKLARYNKTHQLLFLINEVRRDHPTMGCRDMYYYLQPDFIGRDRFEDFCFENGFSSIRVKNYRKTTDSNGVIRFIDLRQGLEIVRLNQVWVSDITYFELGNKFHYITFITDSFSRRILGYHVSKRLFTEQTTLPALQKATRLRKGMNIVGTILHSDGGGQYYDEEFLKETEILGLRNSMCEYPWDNGKAERINGVIKNNYLIHRAISNYEELVKEVDRSVCLYNEEKPHIALKRLSPVAFEKLYLANGKMSDAEKSTTESKTCDLGKESSPSGRGKMPSASNITPENNAKSCLLIE